ncbi:hypothetical protein O6H91_04G093300 [Diphasiastrum complanatum]|nr:hypothetical protein O6H91_04G093300 [Diphasiastrum complanatum]
MNSIVWQSFDTPTDTLLPGQKYFFNASRKLRSRNGANDWREGRYLCTWDNNSHFNLAWNLSNGPETDRPTYWSQYPQGLDILTYRIIATDYAYVDSLGSLYLVNSTTNSSYLILTSTKILGPLRRVTLDREGTLRIYKWQLGQSSNWSVEADNIQDPCTVKGVCGPYAICSPSSTALSDMIQCKCPHGFESIDSENSFQGCKRIDKPLLTQCNRNKSVELVPLISIDYPFGDYNQSQLSFNTCRQNCLEDCHCDGMVYSFYLQTCWLKGGPLWNGYSLSVDAVRNDRKFYLKIFGILPPILAPTLAPLRAHQKPASRKVLILASSLGTILGFIFLLLIVFSYVTLRRRKLRNMTIETKLERLRSSPVLQFTYSELKAATKNFREEIGRGGFGSVFKGEIGHSGKYAVAVKRLEKLNPAAEKGFLTEVMTIGSIHHVNLVALHGYCAEGSRRLLVYEYVELGSLDRFLFQSQKAPILEWRSRFQIVVETARALMYLHEDCRDYRIIHRDVKPQNILLDKSFHVKLADFGLARLMIREHTRTMTLHGGGTPGYLAPECSFEHSPLTPKIDVFSYGMVVLEIVGGRRNFIYNFPDDPAAYFPAWAIEKMESGAYSEVVDPLLGSDFDMSQIELLVQVAFWCINEKPEVRPSMGLVLMMLEGLVPVEKPIPRPGYLLDWSTVARSQRNKEKQPFSSG